MSGTPLFSVFHEASSSHDILGRAGGGIAISFQDASELDNLVDQIAAGLGRFIETGRNYSAPDPQVYSAYTANAVSAQFASAFGSMTKMTTAVK